MATRDKIEQELDDLIHRAQDVRWMATRGIDARPGLADARARLLALLTPEPEPTMLGMDPLESVSEYREDRLKITFTPSPHRPNELMVKLAGSWTGLTLVRLNVTDGAAWIVPQRPQLGPFRVRGEAVAAAIVTTFDPDNDQTSEPEPSAAEIEAAGKAIFALLPLRPLREEVGRAALAAARAARRTGGAS